MRSKNKPAPTAAERRHIERVAALPCVVCDEEGQILYENTVAELKYAQCIRLAGPMHHFPHHCHERTSGMSNAHSKSKFCKRCEADTERNSRGECRACARASSAAWQAANPEKVKARRAAYRAANPDKLKASYASWASANPEKIKARNTHYHEANKERERETGAAYRAVNAEKLKAKNQAWRLQNPDKVKEQNAKWGASNPDAKRVINQNRRAKVREVGGKLSKDLPQKLFNLQKGKCPVCKDSLSLAKPRSPLDHIVAISNGGSNTDDNMQMLCRTCNQQKHAKHPVDFMQSKGFLL